MEKVKIHEIVKSINIYREQKGEKAASKEEVVNYIKEKYLGIKLSKETPWMNSVKETIKTEVLKAFGVSEKINQNAIKHLFMVFPHSGIFVVPVDLKDSTGGLVRIKTSLYGTTDLSDCAKSLTKASLKDYAEWLEKAYGAKEISFEKFKDYGLQGIAGIKRTGDGKETPNLVDERTDLKKEP